MSGRRELGAPARLALFTGGLAVLFVAALGVGAATGDIGATASDVGSATRAPGPTAHQHDHSATVPATGSTAPGTALSDGGLRLDVPRTTLTAGVVTPFSFTVRTDAGAAVTRFDLEQTKRLHLVVVDRGLQRFAHLHPVMAPDGTWTTPLTLAPGSYRAVADVVVDGARHALAVDLVAPGPLAAPPLPAPSATTTVDGLDVRLDRDGRRLAFTVTRDGAPVALQPYLGAAGHLVAFRAGDLAYTHVHPVEGTTFDADLPGPGTYRLFLEVRHDGRVSTAPFTLEVTA